MQMKTINVEIIVCTKAHFGNLCEGHLNLINGYSNSASLMEEIKTNGVLLIKYNIITSSLWLPLSFPSHICSCFSRTHIMGQNCVCTGAGGLRGLILALARYSHKSDRPTNYPQNYSILMFELTVCVCVCLCRNAGLNIFLFLVCMHVWMRDCLLCRQLEVVSCMLSRWDRCVFQLFVLRS